MNCDACQKSLADLFFDELDDTKALAIHEHLAACDQCREEYIEMVETQKKIKNALTGKEDCGLSAEHKKSILKRIKNQSSPFTLPRWIFPLAACLLVGFVLFFRQQADQTVMAENDLEYLGQEKALTAADDVQSLSENALNATEGEKQSRELTPFRPRKDATNFDSAVAIDESSVVMIDSVKEKSDTFFPSTSGSKKSIKNENSPTVRRELDKNGIYDTNGDAPPDNVALSVVELKQLLTDYLAETEISVESKQLANELKSLADETILLLVTDKKKTQSTASEKILVRVLRSDKNIIDYANVYIRHLRIIQLERVDKN